MFGNSFAVRGILSQMLYGGKCVCSSGVANEMQMCRIISIRPTRDLFHPLQFVPQAKKTIVWGQDAMNANFIQSNDIHKEVFTFFGSSDRYS